MSLRRCVSALGALLVLTSSMACTGPGSRRDSGTVTLRFDWPVGLAAFVETERSTRKSGAPGSSAMSVRMSYRIDVDEAPEGRLIRYGGVRAEDPQSGRSYTLDQLPEPMASQFNVLLPSFLVSNDGQVVRLEGSESLIEETRRKLRRQWEKTQDESAEIEALVAASVNEESLLEMAREHWDPLVGAWSGMSLVVGETRQREDQLAVPALGGVQIPAALEFGVVQRLPCNEEMVTADCVAIEMLWRPLPEALDRLEKAMLAGLRSAAAGTFDVLENLAIEQSSYLVTEPSTLIPHYLETTTKFLATRADPGEEAIPVEELDQHIYRYSYPPRADQVSPRRHPSGLDP